jgi:hypothetical protein
MDRNYFLAGEGALGRGGPVSSCQELVNIKRGAPAAADICRYAVPFLFQPERRWYVAALPENSTPAPEQGSRSLGKTCQLLAGSKMTGKQNDGDSTVILH